VPEIAGLQYYKLRMYPYNESLSHPFELGCMIWI
jgi:starch phosphorylase